MKSEISVKNDLTNELVNIAAIREAEQVQREEIAKANNAVSEKIIAAMKEADKVKEKVISDARSERKMMIQQAIDQARDKAKEISEEQANTANNMINRGEKWINSAADFVVKYILGEDREKTE
jgi:vacuolar-type H+-ATPase subunit H